MNKTMLLFAAILLLGLGCAATDENTRQQAQINRRVRRLLSRMTLEEKIGQMTQITLESFISSDAGDSLILDPEKLREGIVSHHIGSIFNCGGQARSAQRWQTIITQIQDIATKETRLGIPILYGIDSVHGANYVRGATLFPQNIAMAATGNVELIKRVGEITANETRAAGIPWNFSPVLGLARQPMWPRVFETFGEDAYVASVMGAAYIDGLQGDDLSRSDKVAACMKHYAGYSLPYSGQDRTPAYIPERQMRELFLRPFAAAVKAGAATCMVNSSEINGIPVHTDRYLLDDILRGEWGFEGLIVSDWADIENLYTREKVAADRREAVRMAVMAGIDMSMVPYDYSFAETLIGLVREGEVPVKRIDEAVTRILKLKFRLGLFDSPYPRESRIAAVGTDEAQAVNLQAAREAITLLKNDRNVLPLRTDWRILVTGPCADELSVLNGVDLGWQPRRTLSAGETEYRRGRAREDRPGQHAFRRRRNLR
jgi:beta-glucosidase